jgi:hypothetical protein
MPSPSLLNSLTRNQSQKCKISGCTRFRHKLASRCRLHQERFTIYGNRDGRIWPARILNGHVASAAEFVIFNRHHPATIQALEYVSALLEQGQRAFDEERVLTIQDKVFGTLSQQLVPPETVLARALAVTAHLRFVSDDRHGEPMLLEFIQALGRYVTLLLVKPPSGMRGRTRHKHVGNALYGGLKKFLFAYIGYLGKAAEAEKVFAENCKQPFRTTPP